MGYGIYAGMNIRSDDIIYCTLPLYHSAGGVLGISGCLLMGATVVIRRKFSASRFWDECVQTKATVSRECRAGLCVQPAGSRVL